MSKKHRHHQSSEEGPKTIRADRVICGDRVKIKSCFLEVSDAQRRGETIVMEMRFAKGGSIQRTYHVDEVVEVEHV